MRRKSFNSDWYFSKEDGTATPQVIGPIIVPHDAMMLEKRDPAVKNNYNTGYFPGGIYHYLKSFHVPDEYRHKNIIIEFEGIYMNSKVFLNGQLAGERPYGYTNFYITADNYLKYGQENQIEVVVQNDKEPNSRWYSGSGIYRNVKIMVGNLLHIPPDGVRITTKEIQPDAARLEVLTDLVNNHTDVREVHILTEFHLMDGDTVASNESTALINAGETTCIRQMIPIPQPRLWSVDHPNLYTCLTTVIDKNQVIEENIETFGIRMLELDAKNGLRINGEMIKLRGGCIHNDNGVIGACSFEAAEDRRVRIMKKSGFNAIRSAHNPMSKVMLDACDRHGMLVMDEFSDVWFQSKTKYDYSQYFNEWWEHDIQAMVDKDYNHPCVIMYSIGNEISETAIPEGVEYSQKITEKIRSLDQTRYVINSINGWLSYFAVLQQKLNRKTKPQTFNAALNDNSDKNIGMLITPILMAINRYMDRIVSLSGIDHYTKEAYATVDVAGYNYMSGRYEKDGKRYPERVICGSETFPPEIAKNWRLVKKLPYVIGDFSWAGWDYLGEAGLCTWQYGGNNALFKAYPCILADSSLIDITGHRQTQSYMHEIVWGLRTEPFIAVQPVNHSGERRSKTLWRGTNAINSWTWHGYEGKRAVIEVYANAVQVELFLNDMSLGRKPAGDRHDFKAIYEVIYQPGELTAVSFDKNGSELGRATLKTGHKQVQLIVQPEISKLKADGADLAFINIFLADKDGIVNPLAESLVTVQVEGHGQLAGFGSASPFTEESFTDSMHTTFQGRALVAIRAATSPGEVRVTISAKDCEPKVITFSVE